MVNDETARVHFAVDQHRIGAEALADDRFDEAERHLRAAAETYESLGRREDAAAEFLYVGLAAEPNGRLDAALAAYLNAAQIFQGLTRHAERASALRNAANVLMKLGRGDEARAYLTDALALFTAAGDISGVATVQDLQAELGGDVITERQTVSGPGLYVITGPGESAVNEREIFDLVRWGDPWVSVHLVLRDPHRLQASAPEAGVGDAVIYFADMSLTGADWAAQVQQIDRLEAQGARVFVAGPPGVARPPDSERLEWIEVANHADLQAAINRLSEEPVIDFNVLDATAFEELVADALRAVGFRDLAREGRFRHGQADLAGAYERSDPFGQTIVEQWIVDVRFYRSQRPDLRSLRELAGLIDQMDPRTEGLYVTNGRLTSAAKEWLGATQARIRVLDGDELRRVLTRHPRVIRRHFPQP